MRNRLTALLGLEDGTRSADGRPQALRLLHDKAIGLVVNEPKGLTNTELDEIWGLSRC